MNVYLETIFDLTGELAEAREEIKRLRADQSPDWPSQTQREAFQKLFGTSPEDYLLIRFTTIVRDRANKEGLRLLANELHLYHLSYPDMGSTTCHRCDSRAKQALARLERAGLYLITSQTDEISSDVSSGPNDISSGVL